MNENVFFSFVIPAFNVSEYIISCLKSILEQDYDNFEIIVVDDGSTDDSIVKVKKIQDDRIKVISQRNQGVSAARNTGIAHASGDYIIFLDSDDMWCCNDGLSSIAQVITNSTEIVAFDYIKSSENEPSKELDAEFAYPLTGRDFMKTVLEKDLSFPWYVYRYAFKRTFFQNFSFPVGVIYEDVKVLPTVILSAKDIIVLDKCIYLYRYQRENSITSSSKSIKNIRALMEAAASSLEYVLAISLPKEHRKIIAYSFAANFNKVLDYYSELNNSDKKELKKILDKYFPAFFPHLQSRKKLSAISYKLLGPGLTTKLLRMRK